MSSFRNRLPSLTALTVFEAAARHRSFTKAADELRVTQAAVSRQIASLEQNLGFALFVRGHRSVELTERGRLLSFATSNAFGLVADALSDIQRKDVDESIAVSTTVAFAHFWLMPRLPSFTAAYPNVKLRIVTRDTLVDLNGGDIDLAVRFGSGSWPDGQADLLFQDEIFPVCSPDYLARSGPIETPADLSRHALLSNETDDPSWTGWLDWLAAFEVLPTARSIGLRCSFYTDTIQAALNGQGVALGWKRLIADLMNQERLVRVTSAAVAPHDAYFVVSPKRRSKEGAQVFVEWIKGTARVMSV